MLEGGGGRESDFFYNESKSTQFVIFFFVFFWGGGGWNRRGSVARVSKLFLQIIQVKKKTSIIILALVVTEILT